MAAAVGAVLMLDDHKDDIALAATGQRDSVVAEAAEASANDSSTKRAEHVTSDEPARQNRRRPLRLSPTRDSPLPRPRPAMGTSTRR